uniref:Phage protein n=1 Tax=Strongyloides venezuelensis TaxID=75913 RepID=A0A0K0G520_STRVS
MLMEKNSSKRNSSFRSWTNSLVRSGIYQVDLARAKQYARYKEVYDPHDTSYNEDGNVVQFYEIDARIVTMINSFHGDTNKHIRTSNEDELLNLIDGTEKVKITNWHN